MTNLTEQYRKGELPRNKVYYVKNDGEIFSCRLDWDNDFIHEGRIIHPEVLDEVPSYEEYQKLLSDQLAKNEGVEINAELEAENKELKETISNDIFLIKSRDSEIVKLKEDYDDLRKQKNEADNVILEQMAKVRQLKELLKQARGCVAVVISRTIAEVNGIDTKKLLAKIDQVLGEE